MDTSPRPSGPGVRRRTLLRLISATAFALVVSLWAGAPGALAAGAQAAEAGTPLVAAASSLVWVRDATPVVNANNDPTEISAPEPRFAGSFTKLTPTATRFSTQECYVDHQVQYYNLTITCTFATPPGELSPGKSYSLGASFSHSGTNNQGGEGLGEQFWYSSSLKDVVSPATALKYYPWSPGFSGPSDKTWTVIAPEPTAGATFQVNAGLWNRPPCNVTWTYRAREKTAAATSTTEPAATTSSTTTTEPSSTGSTTTSTGQRDPSMRTFTDKEFEKVLADTMANNGTMTNGYIGVVIACTGEVVIYDYSGVPRKGVRGSKIRIGDTVVTHDKGRVRVQMADRDEERDAGPSVINVTSQSAMAFMKFLADYDEPHQETLTHLIHGAARILFEGWGSKSNFSVRAGVALCGIRGSDVVISYDPESESLVPPGQEGPVEFLGARVLEGHMDVASETTGKLVTLTDKQTLTAIDGTIGPVGTFTQEKWDEWMEAAELEDIEPLLGAELEALLADSNGTTGVPPTTVATSSTSISRTTVTSNGPSAGDVTYEGPSSTSGSWLSWGLPVLIVVGVMVLVVVGVGVYLLRKRGRRAGGRAALPAGTPTPGPDFCRYCGSALPPGTRFCGQCGEKL